MGRHAGYTGTRFKVLAALSDVEWRLASAVASAAGIRDNLAHHHLKMLERDGLAECRGPHNHRRWRWKCNGFKETN